MLFFTTILTYLIQLQPSLYSSVNSVDNMLPEITNDKAMLGDTLEFRDSSYCHSHDKVICATQPSYHMSVCVFRFMHSTFDLSSQVIERLCAAARRGSATAQLRLGVFT
jgi:hypothetical protein